MSDAESTNRYNEQALEFGELTHAGVDYALEAVPALSQAGQQAHSRAGEGEAYQAEYVAPGIGRDTSLVELVWRFQVVRGREPDDDFTGWWDGVDHVRPR